MVRFYDMKAIVAFLLFVLVCAFAPVHVFAESVRSLIARGNDLYAAGEYDSALKAYEQAGTEQPDSAEVWFNKGDVFFQKGDYDKAREAYENAAVRTRDLTLEARSHFNLGNTAFAEGQKQLTQDAKKALSQLGASVRHYQEALRVDPQLRDAARNMEVARIKMQDVLDRIRKQEEQSKEHEARREELLKQLDEAAREQESELGASRELKKNMDESPGKSFGEEAEKLSRDQEMTREKTAEVFDKLKTSSSPSQSESGTEAQAPRQPPGEQAQDDSGSSAADHLEKALEVQKSAVEKLDNLQPGEAKDHQQEALDNLKEAFAELSGSQEESRRKASEDRKEDTGERKDQSTAAEQRTGEDQKQEEGQGERQSSPKQPDEQKKQQGGEQKQQSAEPRQQVGDGEKRQGQEGEEPKARAALRELPTDILREEKENRLRLERSSVGAYKPVERDW